MARPILIWGRGGHAHVVRDHIIDHSEMICDKDPNYLDGSWREEYPPYLWDTFVAIGDNDARYVVTWRLANLGYNQVNIISPRAWVSPWATLLGQGIFIGPMACVCNGARLGDGVIINTGATVDHDCIISDYVHIAPGAHLCGNVIVGPNTLIGVGTSVIPGTMIASDCIVAGGSSVAHDLELPFTLYAGNPARAKKQRE